MCKFNVLAAAVAALLSTSAAYTTDPNRLKLQAAHNGHPYDGQIVMYAENAVVERMDPIITPGGISQHVHVIFGSDKASPNATYESLQETNCTTIGMDGDGNGDDNSMYWHPAMYAQAANGSGYVRVPNSYHKTYYSDRGSLDDEIVEPFEFPKGFKMLANSPFQRAPLDNKKHQGRVTQWVCHGDHDPPNEGAAGGFPKIGGEGCTNGFVGSVHFPHCWNGQDYNPADPFAHVVYPDGDPESDPCPDSHKKRLPHLFVENYFDLQEKIKNNEIRTDRFTLAMGDDTGFGFHMDFLNGWKVGALPALYKRCNVNSQTQGIAVCDDPQGSNNHVKGKGGFNRNGKDPDQCYIQPTYKENVEYPGHFLPGCNPISNLNPAPIMQVAALGISTDQCSPASGVDQGIPIVNSAIPALSSVVNNALPAATSSPAQAAANAPVSSSAPSSASTTPPSSAAAQVKAAATASSDQLKCPGDDGKQYTASNGKVFQVECGVDHAAGNLDMIYATSLANCIAACASHSDCVDVSLSGSACWMKKSLGKAVHAQEVSGAKLISGGSAGASSAASSGSMITTTTVIPTHSAGAPPGQTVWITTEVTVTATHAAYTMQARDEHAHAHAHAHKHARYHVGRRAF